MLTPRAGLTMDIQMDAHVLSLTSRPQFIPRFIIYTHRPCAAYFNDITHASILQCVDTEKGDRCMGSFGLAWQVGTRARATQRTDKPMSRRDN